MSKKPYMGMPRPKSKYMGTARTHYVIGFENLPLSELNYTGEKKYRNAILLSGHYRNTIAKLLQYALDYGYTDVIDEDGISKVRANAVEQALSFMADKGGALERGIKVIYKYWITDELQAVEFAEKLFPFPVLYGICNFGQMDSGVDDV